MKEHKLYNVKKFHIINFLYNNSHLNLLFNVFHDSLFSVHRNIVNTVFDAQ